MEVEKIKLAGRSCKVLTAPTMTAFSQWAKGGSRPHCRDAWAGGSKSQAHKMCEQGDLTLVERSDALLAAIEDSIDVEGLRPVLARSVAGGVPSVPAYLAGHPLNMLTRRKVQSERGEIVVMAGIFLSASISHENYQRRGAALLALVRVLSQVRPIRLFAYVHHTESGTSRRPDYFMGYPIDAAPLDLARAAWALTDPMSYRRIFLDADKRMGDSAAHPNEEKSRAAAADFATNHLGADGFITTPPMISSSGNVAFKSDETAAAWVQEKIKEGLAA